MKLYSPDLEFRAIRTITQSDETVASFVLGSINSTYFHYEPCLRAFERITALAKSQGKLPVFADLLSDPALDEDMRDVLRESKPIRAKTQERAEVMVASLDTYRKIRTLYFMAKHINTTLKAESVDVDVLLDDVSDHMMQARSGDNLAQMIRLIGRDGNANDMVDEILDMQDEIMLKTGWPELDAKNGGLPSEGVVLLAGTTSGGKSTVLQNLLYNILTINEVDVCNVSLEMSDLKQGRRFLSMLTQIPFFKFIHKKLSPDERSLAKKLWRRFVKGNEKRKVRYSMLNPTHAVSIQQLLMSVKPYGFKVIGVDYISLLDGVDQKDQWKALGEIARQCKIFSTANKCLIILLAQLDSDDDHIRYSKTILEHADAAIIWNYSKPEQRDLKQIPMRVLKMRDGQLMTFDLQEMFETMTVKGLEGAGSADVSAEDASGASSGADVTYDDDLDETTVA